MITFRVPKKWTKNSLLTHKKLLVAQKSIKESIGEEKRLVKKKTRKHGKRLWRLNYRLYLGLILYHSLLNFKTNPEVTSSGIKYTAQQERNIKSGFNHVIPPLINLLLNYRDKIMMKDLPNISLDRPSWIFNITFMIIVKPFFVF